MPNLGILQRGQIYTTYKEIQDGLSWYIGYRKKTYTNNQVNGAMKKLRDYDRITTTKDLDGVLITICKYDTYQNPNNYVKTNENATNQTTKTLTKTPIKPYEAPYYNIKKTFKALHGYVWALCDTMCGLWC